MTKVKQDINNIFTRVAFIILFVLMISAFADKSIKQDKNLLTQHELVLNIKSTNTTAIAINPVQLPNFHKCWALFVDKLNFKFSETKLKIFTTDNKIAQEIISLQKAQHIIKPILISRFCYHFYSLDSKELPILS